MFKNPVEFNKSEESAEVFPVKSDICIWLSASSHWAWRLRLRLTYKAVFASFLTQMKVAVQRSNMTSVWHSSCLVLRAAAAGSRHLEAIISELANVINIENGLLITQLIVHGFCACHHLNNNLYTQAKSSLNHKRQHLYNLTNSLLIDKTKANQTNLVFIFMYSNMMHQDALCKILPLFLVVNLHRIKR